MGRLKERERRYRQEKQLIKEEINGNTSVLVPRLIFWELVELASSAGWILQDIDTEFGVQYIPYNPRVIRQHKIKSPVSAVVAAAT